MSPTLFKWRLNWFGPYLGAGIKVETYSKDWRYCKVVMKLAWYNKNAVNTQFGGSLYSMVDPHYMLMLMQILGREFTIWDKSAEIDFIRPGKGKVYAEFRFTEADIKDIREKTADGNKYLPQYWVEVKDLEGNIVCKVRITLYIKKKFNPNARF